MRTQAARRVMCPPASQEQFPTLPVIPASSAFPPLRHAPAETGYNGTSGPAHVPSVLRGIPCPPSSPPLRYESECRLWFLSGSFVQASQAPFSFVSQRSSGSELPPPRLSRLPGHCSFPLPGRPVHWGRFIVPECLRRRVRPEPTKEKPTWATTLVVQGAKTTRAQQRLAHSRRFRTQLARTSPRPAAELLQLSSLYGTNFRRALPLARLRRRSNGQTVSAADRSQETGWDGVGATTGRGTPRRARALWGGAAARGARLLWKPGQPLAT